MSHSYYKIWLHVVFSTKDRKPLIDPDIEKKIFAYMKNQLIECGCPVRIINGMPDHVHLLYLQNPNIPVADIIKQIKGASSHWINQQNIVESKFAWQTGYGVFSVSESQIDKVYTYIKNQKGHHTKTTFAEEFNEFLEKYNVNVTP